MYRERERSKFQTTPARLLPMSQVKGNRLLMQSDPSETLLIEKCAESANGVVQIPGRFDDLLLTLREIGLNEVVYKAIKRMSPLNRYLSERVHVEH